MDEDKDFTSYRIVFNASNVVMWTVASIYALSIMYGDSIVGSITRL